MASTQVNLLFVAGVVVLLYVSVARVEAHECGYHYHTNEYFTIYYSTYHKRCYHIHYGNCYNGVWVQDGRYTNPVDNFFYCITMYYNGKRSSSAGEVDTYSGTTNRDTGLSENDQTKRDVETSDKIKKRIQVSDYGGILKALGQKRTERAFQKADYGKVAKNSVVKREAEETKEQA